MWQFLITPIREFCILGISDKVTLLSLIIIFIYLIIVIFGIIEFFKNEPKD